MATYQVTFNRMWCERDTIEVSADEVFLAAIPVLGTLDPAAVDGSTLGPADINGRLLKGHLTRTERRVRGGREWIPDPSSFRFEASPDETLGLALYLYERDDGRLRRGIEEAFQKGTWPVTVRDDPDWAKVWRDLVSRVVTLDEPATGPAIVVKVLSAVVAVLPEVIKALRKDDLIAARVLTAPLNDSTSFISRALRFEGDQGVAAYGMEVTLSRVHEAGDSSV